MRSDVLISDVRDAVSVRSLSGLTVILGQYPAFCSTLSRPATSASSRATARGDRISLTGKASFLFSAQLGKQGIAARPQQSGTPNG